MNRRAPHPRPVARPRPVAGRRRRGVARGTGRRRRHDGARWRGGGRGRGRRRPGGVVGAPHAWHRPGRAALRGAAGDPRRHVPCAGRSAGMVLSQSRAQHRRRPGFPPGRRRTGPAGRRYRGARRALPAHPGAARRRGDAVPGPGRADRVAQRAARPVHRRPVCHRRIRAAGAERPDGRGRRRRNGRCRRCAAYRRARCADRVARGPRLRGGRSHAGRRAGARGDAAGGAARTRRPRRARPCGCGAVRAGGHPRPS